MNRWERLSLINSIYVSDSVGVSRLTAIESRDDLLNFAQDD
jgi:hypothetical protein